MFVGLVDTRKPEPEPEDEREPLLERVPELQPWRGLFGGAYFTPGLPVT